jgi:hypothetical protein
MEPRDPQEQERGITEEPPVFNEAEESETEKDEFEETDDEEE